jgi:hypothetical protein
VNENVPPTFSSAVFEALGREQPRAVPVLHELEEGVRKFHTIYSVGLTVADDETFAAMGGTLEESIQLRITYIQVSLARRLAALLVSLIDHINGVRLLDAALSTRACLELAGALVYYEQRITALMTTGVSTPHEMDRLNDIVRKATRGGRFDWVRWLSGGADLQALIAEYAVEGAKPRSPMQGKNVTDFIDALDSAVAAEEPPPGAIRAVYALLCDLCHPAVGGYMLYVSLPQFPGQLTFGAHPNPRVASWFVGSIIGSTANRLMKHAARSLNRLTQIAKSVKARVEAK